MLAFSADGLARLVEDGLLATGISVAVIKSVGFIRCLEAQVEDPLWDLVKRELRTHHVHLLAAGLGILSMCVPAIYARSLQLPHLTASHGCPCAERRGAQAPQARRCARP